MYPRYHISIKGNKEKKYPAENLKKNNNYNDFLLFIHSFIKDDISVCTEFSVA